jgi:hypothetical protein
MVVLKGMSLTLDGITEPVTGFEVWFSTPLGLTTNLDEAIEKCESNDLIPDLNIAPVAVAVTPTRRYEVLSR